MDWQHKGNIQIEQRALQGLWALYYWSVPCICWNWTTKSTPRAINSGPDAAGIGGSEKGLHRLHHVRPGLPEVAIEVYRAS